MAPLNQASNEEGAEIEFDGRGPQKRRGPNVRDDASDPVGSPARRTRDQSAIFINRSAFVRTRLLSDNLSEEVSRVP